MEKKVCKKCGYSKDLNSFNKNKNQKDGLQKYCKICKSIIDKKYNLKYPLKQKTRNKKKIDKKTRLKEEWKIKMGGECKKCGNTRLYTLDFHHLDETNKRIDISTLIGHVGPNNPLIKEEVNKCILLCSNCHREFHHFEKIKNINIEQYLSK